MFKNITLEKIARFVSTLAALALLVFILYNFSILFAYAVIAVLLSYLLDPLVSRMQAAGMNRTLAIILTLSTVILVIVWISTSIIPIIANQMAALAGQLNMENIRLIATKIEQQLIEHFDFLTPGFLQENLTRLSENLFDAGRIQNIMSDLIGIFTNLFYALLVIPFSTFFFLKDGGKIRRDLLQLVPNKYFETTLTLLDKIERSLGVYFRSVLLQSSLVAFFSWVFLSISGMTNSASVGVAIGVANTIPYFGPILGYILSFIISIIETGDFTLVVPSLTAVLMVQILDNVLFQPMIFSKSADIHPVAILFIILIGAEIAGILGMLVAIPIATVIRITISQISWSLKNYHVYRVESTESLSMTDHPEGRSQATPP